MRLPIGILTDKYGGKYVFSFLLLLCSILHQCQECLTVYNADYGDVTQGIEKGVLFADLPEDYHCSLCEAPKSNFINYPEKV